MSQELYYTSAPRGLKMGSKGFCTVAMTAGLPVGVAQRLESLSGYRPVFPPDHADAAKNPVAWSHWRLAIGGSTYSVLSRVCFAGMDYSRRSSKFAHHLVLDESEHPPGGPAWLMLEPDFLQDHWAGEPELIAGGRPVPWGDSTPARCRAWAAVVGDAGWAGALAQSFIANPAKPTVIVFQPGMELLPLVHEALMLLPPQKRWEVTFNTYFNDLPAGLTCAWRFCVAGSAAAKQAIRAAAGGLLIDLTRPLGKAPASRMVQMARTGLVAWASGSEPFVDVAASLSEPPDTREESGELSAAPPLVVESVPTGEALMPPPETIGVEQDRPRGKRWWPF